MFLFSLATLLLVLPAVTLSQNTTTRDTKEGWQSGQNDRSSFDILWACFSTIFACTWTVLHLNVSHPKESESRIFWRHVKTFILSIVLPEYTLAVAADQYLEARFCVKSFEKSKLENLNRSVDTGVESSQSSIQDPRVASEEKTLGNGITQQPSSSVGDGAPANEPGQNPENSQQDPKNTSAYAEDWTLAHGFFTTMGGLAIQTEDEKEYSILRNDDPVKLLESGRVRFPRVKAEDINRRSKADGFVKFVAVCQSTWFAINVVARPAYELHVTPIELASAAYVLCAVFTYALWWHKPKDVTVPIIINVPSASAPAPPSSSSSSSLSSDATMNEYPTLKQYLDEPQPRKANNFGGIDMLQFPEPSRSNEEECRYSFANIAGLLVALAYSGIHIAAWNFPFPTSAERQAWRICAIASISATAILIPHYFNERYIVERAVLKAISMWVHVICYFCYIVARIALMVLMFMSFRAMPTSCYATVDWLSALPHY